MRTEQGRGNASSRVFRKAAAFFLFFSAGASWSGLAFAAGAGGTLPARISKDRDGFHAYLPSYLGIALDHSDHDNVGEIKFQLSVKYELVNDSDWFFGYTQKSFWSIHQSSSPFRETNFAPELFWQYRPPKRSWFPAVQFGFYRHESTGEAGPGSQGWDISYVEPVFYWKGLYLLPRLWAPSALQGFDEKKAAPDNPDLFRYFGYGHLTIIAGAARSTQFSLTLQHAPIDDRITWEAQADLPWRRIAALWGGAFATRWNPNFFIQVREGYGESLKSYNRTRRGVVMGVSLVH